MSLKGAAYRFIEATTIASGTPGGILRVTFAAQPVAGNYPALGEPIDTLIAGLPQAKVPTGVKPSNGIINDNLGHLWQFDQTQAGMGTFRNWTAVGNTPTEHVTGAYAGNETSAILRITLDFPLYGDITR